MADIGGINGIDILNIAAYNGTLRTNIAKFQGINNRIEGDFYTGSLINRYDPFFYTSGKLLDSGSADNNVTITGATYVGTGASHFSFDGVDDSGICELTETENLVLRSNEFDVSPWVFSNTTPANAYSFTGSQAGYDGTNDAWLVNKPTTINQYLRQQVTTVGTEYTFSGYFKAGTLTTVTFFFGTPVINFDLTTGNTVSWFRSVSNYNSVDVGNGWWYLYFTFTASSVNISVKFGNASLQNVVGSAYMQDIQVTEGATLKPYVESGASTGIFSTPTITENHSMGVWVKWDELTGTQIPFGKYNGNEEEITDGVWFYVDNDILYYKSKIGVSTQTTQVMTVSTNEWYYLCASHDVDGNVNVWVGDSNGFNQKVTSASHPIITDGLGVDLVYGDATNLMKGDISNAHTYSENVSEENWENNWTNQKALYGY